MEAQKSRAKTKPPRAILSRNECFEEIKVGDQVVSPPGAADRSKNEIYDRQRSEGEWHKANGSSASKIEATRYTIL